MLVLPASALGLRAAVVVPLALRGATPLDPAAAAAWLGRRVGLPPAALAADAEPLCVTLPVRPRAPPAAFSSFAVALGCIDVPAAGASALGFAAAAADFARVPADDILLAGNAGMVACNQGLILSFISR